MLLIPCIGIISLFSVKARIASDEKTTQAVIQLNEQIDKAWLDSDAETYKRLLADDFTYISSAGEFFFDKDKYVEGIKHPEVRWESETSSEVKARMYGDTVILTGRLFSSWRYQNQDFHGRYRYTRVYVWKQDHWLLVAWQNSKMNE